MWLKKDRNSIGPLNIIKNFRLNDQTQKNWNCIPSLVIFTGKMHHMWLMEVSF